MRESLPTNCYPPEPSTPQEELKSTEQIMVDFVVTWRVNERIRRFVLNLLANNGVQTHETQRRVETLFRYASENIDYLGDHVSTPEKPFVWALVIVTVKLCSLPLYLKLLVIRLICVSFRGTSLLKWELIKILSSLEPLSREARITTGFRWNQLRKVRILDGLVKISLVLHNSDSPSLDSMGASHGKVKKTR